MGFSRTSISSRDFIGYRTYQLRIARNTAFFKISGTYEVSLGLYQVILIIIINYHKSWIFKKLVSLELTLFIFYYCTKLLVTNILIIWRENIIGLILSTYKIQVASKYIRVQSLSNLSWCIPWICREDRPLCLQKSTGLRWLKIYLLTNT